MWSGKEEEEKDDASVISDMRSSHAQSSCVKPCSPDHGLIMRAIPLPMEKPLDGFIKHGVIGRR